MQPKTSFALVCSLFLLAATSLTSQAQLLWTVGLDDNGWPMGDGGGANASFVQENGSINDLPGSQDSTEDPRGADNDYYFAGDYSKTIASVTASYGDYVPVGVVSVDEEAAERAFAAADNDLRYHFNLPSTLKADAVLTVTFDSNNLHTDGQADPRYGVEVYFNGVKIQDEILIRPAQLDKDFTTPQFNLAKVNAKIGPGFDNIVSLRGINYNADGGGNWMGIDYVRLDVVDTSPKAPQSPFPWSVGLDDNGWPLGDGGAGKTSFVQENGVINPLPGSPSSTEVSRGADNDYYFAGVYTNVIAGNGVYKPVGVVSVNEEAAERAFAAADNDLRYHFNLPSTLKTNDLLTVTFDALNLDDPSAANTDPRYGIEVYFNGVRVQNQIVIRRPELDQDYTTPPFSLASVNARVGPGFDNILSLRGINYNTEGGGNWMGIDYVQLKRAIPPPPVLPWSVGLDDNGWPLGDGGGANTSFVQENGVINPLPGSPESREISTGADNDYYFAGIYTNVIASNGAYTPVGEVYVNEEAAERAFAAADNDLRYHFNLPSSLKTDDKLTVTFDANNLHTDGQADPRYGVEVYFNGVKVQSEILIRPPDLDTDYTTPPFTLASVNAKAGPGFDNIVSLRGINYNADGGGNWMGIDFVQLNAVVNTNAPLAFLKPSVANGKLTLNWTGAGNLERASAVIGPWTPITPAPVSPYSENIVAAQNRFYRLRR